MAKIDDVQGMLKMVLNNLSAFKQEIVGKIDKLDKKIDWQDR